VYGGGRPSANFISAVLLEAKRRGCVEIMQSPLSSKDYIHIDDVCLAIERVVIDGGQTVYNVAAGENVTHQQIADRLALEGIKVQFQGAETVRFEPIRVDKLRSITDWRPRSLVGEISTLLKEV
jgi:nucleoside-diphosphate-sugar epimerase